MLLASVPLHFVPPAWLARYGPLLPYMLLALGLIAALALFVSVKREIHLLARKNDARYEEIMDLLSEDRLREAERLSKATQAIDPLPETDELFEPAGGEDADLDPDAERQPESHLS